VGEVEGEAVMVEIILWTIGGSLVLTILVSIFWDH
jgi:hypothetical protein